MIYNVFFAAIAGLGVFTIGDERLRRFLFYIILVFIFVFVAFRFDVGCDWGGYEIHYERSSDLNLSEVFSRREVSFWLLLVILNGLNLPYPYLNVVSAGLFFFGIYYLAQRQPDPLAFLVLSFPVLVMGIPMSATRQALASGILCFAFVAFNDRKLVKYLLLVAVATTFHASTIVFFVLAPFIVFGVGNRRFITAASVAVVSILYIVSMGIFDPYTELYIGTHHDAAGGPVRVAAVATTGLAFLVFLRRRWAVLFPQDYNLIVLGSALMVLNLGFVFISSVIGDRFGYYLSLIQLIIMCKAYTMFRPDEYGRNILFLIPYLMGGAMLLGWSQLSWIFSDCYGDYKTWLQSGITGRGAIPFLDVLSRRFPWV